MSAKLPTGLYDQHLHSRHSFDSEADPVANVQRAIDVGLSGLTFTEHYDTHPDEWPKCVYDGHSYGETIESLRNRFGRNIFVGRGVEIDYQADNIEALVPFADDNAFDVVLLSVHWSQGQPIHIESVWRDRDPSEVARRYLESVRSAVRHCERIQKGRLRVFDCLGHLDFCKRYADRFSLHVSIDEHMDVVDGILEACLEADIIPEVNTSTIRGGMGEPMPGLGVIRRYAELGGTMMSLGSDSHRSHCIGADFDQAISLLRDAGIDQVALFEQRQRRTVSIAPTRTDS
jgi:histidinol-phosphatase (PHP family)